MSPLRGMYEVCESLTSGKSETKKAVRKLPYHEIFPGFHRGNVRVPIPATHTGDKQMTFRTALIFKNTYTVFMYSRAFFAAIRPELTAKPMAVAGSIMG